MIDCGPADGSADNVLHTFNDRWSYTDMISAIPDRSPRRKYALSLHQNGRESQVNADNIFLAEAVSLAGLAGRMLLIADTESHDDSVGLPPVERAGKRV